MTQEQFDQHIEDNRVSDSEAATLKASLQAKLDAGIPFVRACKEIGLRYDEANKLRTIDNYNPYKE